MIRRVIECGEVKHSRVWSRSESESEMGVQSHSIDPKLSELTMARMKRG